MGSSSAARVRIQRFHVVNQLGAGAMGAVYRARDPELGRDVAIKVLSRPAAQARDELASHHTIDLRDDAPAGELLAEARMMARLSHPNVVPVYEVGLADDEVFVVMEYIAGADLRAWLALGRSTRAIVGAFAQAARGLAAAHAHGIVHRDFKPENVLVGDDGRVRVADFGLSLLSSHEAPPLRLEPTIGGTPYYMAPELWRGAEATARSDVFALSTALAEAFGDHPDRRAELDRTLRAAGLDRRLRAAIAAGLAKDPRARPPLDDFVAALTVRRRALPRLAIAAAGAALAGAALVVAARGAGPACEADRVRLVGVGDAPRAFAAPGVADLVERQHGRLRDALRAVCKAEEEGQLSAAQARLRTSCVERRAFELEAELALVARDKLDASTTRDRLGQAIPVRECDDMVAPPLPDDRAAAAGLYRRMVAARAMPYASPGRSEALAAVERDARALGERELEASAAVLLGMRQIETDQLAAADASFARGYERAIAIHATGVAVDALVERAVAAETKGDAAVAHTYSQLAVELADKTGATVGTRVYVYWGLARSELARGQPARAVEVARKALGIIRDDPERELDLRNIEIAGLEDMGGRAEEALQLARQNLELSRRTLGEDDADHGIALNVVAMALRYNGERESALDYRRRALAVMAKRLRPDHSVVLGQRMNIAADLHANGQLEEARAEASAVLAIADKNESTRQFRADSLADLGVYTFATGRTREGMRLFEQGLEALVSQKGQDHPDALSYRVELVDFELELGRLDDAERHIEALERSYRARGDQERALLRLDGMFRARLLLDRDAPREAEAHARTALAGWQEVHGDEGDREEVLRVLGASLARQHRWSEALDALAGATAIATSRRELPDRFALIDIERARSLAGLGRTAEAEAVARRARGALERFPGQVRARAEVAALLGRRRSR